AVEAKKATLAGADGRKWRPAISSNDDEQYVYSISFEGPFPESSEFTLALPAGLKDDAGRTLANASQFPLAVSTDAYPPLAKFAANFGILELKDSPVLPVTLRNVEASVKGRLLTSAQPQEPLQGKVQGKAFRVSTLEEMLAWMEKTRYKDWDDRDKSIFDEETSRQTRSFSVPKLEGEKAFEVVGIPLEQPGFYVVELESEILGAALLGKAAPMYVQATALVTDLSVHFKWGNESSLVWVTTLSDAKPVPNAAVEVRDCEGKVRWSGKTDRDGVARTEALPRMNDLPYCESYLSSGLAVAARLGDDMSFVLTSWDDGIEPWRFGLPTEWNPDPIQAHTVFDRTLFRPGETAHMKHILRRRTMDGFAAFATQEIKDTVTIIHSGSEQKYEIALKSSSAGSAESVWEIPKDAKLGGYAVYLRKSGESDEYSSRIYAGNFLVQEFRVPLMKAIIRAPAEDLVAPKSFPVDLTATFLAGGGAGSLPVKFRYLVSPRSYLSVPDEYDAFTFTYGKVKEGVVRNDADTDEDRARQPAVKRKELTLGSLGSARIEIDGLPKIEVPTNVLAEMDFKDPNGETQTVSTNIPLWPSARQIGIKPDAWALSREALKFQVVVLDLGGKPVAGAPVTVNLFERKTYSHRKRLVGGFYAYEHSTETRKAQPQPLCSGKTDTRGLLLCESAVAVSGSLILEASTVDEAGREAVAHDDVWVAGDRDWWFAASDNDRMDVLPEAKRYEPGDTMRLQVRMPFRKATALVTVEREGVAETFIRELSGKEPVIELPVKGNWAPNVFVSVMAVRGRANEVQPTATVDLGRPAFRLGVTEVKVGWQAHELKVKVAADRSVYKVREKARVRFAVTTADGTPLPAGSEVAVAAVDEGLLELKPNDSWKLLDAMMGRRYYGVRTYTAQMQVVGKRHFGLKALPQGGGGGQGLTRELFDTLLLWKGTLKLNEKGEADVEIPLNDSLTSFRIVAVATGGAGRFGSGSTSIRTSQDLILFSGVPPLAREGDRFTAAFTARNATENPMRVSLSLKVEPAAASQATQQIDLAAGESREVHFDLTAPQGVDALKYTMEASADGGAADRMSVTQKVIPALPVRMWQATITQLDGKFSIPVEPPADAIVGAGELRVAFQASLTNGLHGVTDYMRRYPYNCLEQQTSKAVVLRDAKYWEEIVGKLPAYLDGDGLAKYFPVMRSGDDTLTAYLVSVAHEAGWKIPANSKERMLDGLRGFVEGRVVRGSSMPTSDLVMRKLAALEALAREGKATTELVSSITVAPNLWPTSAVIDWLNILTRLNGYPNRAAHIKEAQQILRMRLNLQGTTMGFSTESSDRLWWLMVSVDVNAVRLLLSEMGEPEWKQDIPRLVRGALGRQQSGHWDTTVANAWGRLAMEKFSKLFENVPVTGKSTASLAGGSGAAQKKEVDWQTHPKGDAVSFAWPEKSAARTDLDLEMAGTGKPWAVIQSFAAVPLKTPVSSGFKVTRTLVPVEQKKKGVWSAGDIVRVRLDMESQADMTWVVVSDPIPAGASILGTGLGRDSALATGGEKREGWVSLAFEERSFEAYREYYDYVPKGSWSTEYTLRLNGAGRFQLPPTRVEAMYSPEMFGETPAPIIEVK
ncbi:MAG: alpha-2-macroglobulin, partial [Acidobacteriota bacterium]|nr:alpha-2-macroglobulin [Acidobacteriota bacterium]